MKKIILLAIVLFLGCNTESPPSPPCSKADVKSMVLSMFGKKPEHLGNLDEEVVLSYMAPDSLVNIVSNTNTNNLCTCEGTLYYHLNKDSKMNTTVLLKLYIKYTVEITDDGKTLVKLNPISASRLLGE